MKSRMAIGAAAALIAALGAGMTPNTPRHVAPPVAQVQQKKKKRKLTGTSFGNKYSKYNGAALRKMRQKNGVGGRPKGYVDAQGFQMNKLHDQWFEKKFGGAE